MSRRQTLARRITCPAAATLNVRHFLVRHQRTVLAVWTLFLLCLIVAAGEIVLRLTVLYRVDYYTGVKVSNRLVKYPFGDMPFNAEGYPDRQWDARDPRPRVGFFGDSVTMGFGAGYGYRYSDLIAVARPDKYYMNFGGAGEDGIASDRVIDGVLAIARRLHLSKVVYGMNLNDIIPDAGTGPAGGGFLRSAKTFAANHLDRLRSHFYVYNYLRTKVKLAANRLGYGYHGDESFELHPSHNAAVVAATVRRINALSQRLKAQGIGFCVIVFPYEMQISSDAADTYAGFGIRWSGELLAGEPQRQIRRLLAPDIMSVDTREAFANRGAGVKVGEYFVYDKGDALDWNHPNRAGHKRIADYLLTNGAACL